MKRIAPALAGLLLLSACTTPAPLEPIPGSITYNGQPRTRLTKAPVGSLLSHQFNDAFGRRVYETYVVEPDRSLRLVNRRRAVAFFPSP
ncbi:hypothetical protein [Ensifer soli]|uniref:hypothetical protein n=1 Tax=Ciceribacter sp. sgz301302 TaxID=3342379 RepID=UPI0035B6DB65